LLSWRSLYTWGGGQSRCWLPQLYAGVRPPSRSLRVFLAPVELRQIARHVDREAYRRIVRPISWPTPISRTRGWTSTFTATVWHTTARR